MKYANIFLAFLLLFSIIGAHAQVEELSIAVPDEMILPPDYRGGILQNQHYYRVIFDNEGEATVVAKVIVANSGKESLSSVTLDVPGQVRLLSSVQEYQPWVEQCVRYVKECSPCDSGDQRECEVTCEEVCGQWNRHKQWPPTYYSLTAEENVHAEGVQYTLNLGRTIETGEEAIILVAYKSESYANEVLGTWKYDFETIRQNEDIGKVRVAVSVSEDLHLAGTDSGIEYRGGVGDFVAEAKVASPGVQSSTLQEYSQSITYARGIVKTAEALDPLESFHVEGKYSDSYFALNLGKILAWVFGSLVVLVLFVIAIIRLGKMTQRKKSNPLGISILSGIISSVAIIGIFLAGWFGLDLLDQFYYYGGLGAALGVLVMIVWVVLMLALFVVPPIMIGIKYGAMYGALSAGLTLGIVFIISIIGAIGIAIFSSASGGYGGPVYY